MQKSVIKAVKTCVIAAVMPLIVACANMESGMRLPSTQLPAAPINSQPLPTVKLITPELLQDERTVKAEEARQSSRAIVALIGTAQPYVIGNGDMLSILVWDHPELNIATASAQALSSSAAQTQAPVSYNSGAQTPAAFAVDHQGLIQFPYVGAIRLAGLTELEARDLLSKRLVKSIKRPDVTLRVMAYRSKKIYVDGDVKSPGNQIIDDLPMTLLEGISRAGGFLPTSDQGNIVVFRKGVSYPVDLPSLVSMGINPGRIMLADGDVVRVHARDERKVYVLGEVNAPKALPMVNGKLSLTQALGEAGGLNQLSSAAKQIYVVRNAAEVDPLVYNLDAASPVAMALADNFELRRNDVVFVDASGLARFNRLLNLILPTAATAATSYGNFK